MAQSPITNRLDARNFTLAIDGHVIDMAVAYHPDTGAVHEVAFTGRGKIGQGLDLMLHDLTIALSRAIQRRDPFTGEPFEDT